MKGHVWSLLVLIVAALALDACGGTPVAYSPTPTSSPPATAPTAAPTPRATEAARLAATTATVGTLAIVDSLGRSVSFAETPRRIVSLAPSITEILFAVGAGAQVVGDTKYCNYPPEANALPKIGGYTAKTINVEAVVDLTPDLVIAGTASQKPVVEALEELGIRVLVSAPDSFETVYTSIEQIGLVTNHASAAAALVAQMRTRVDAVAARVAAVPAEQRLSVFWEVFDEPLTTAGPHTFVGQIIELAGATNIFADTDQNYPQVSAEEVVERNPAAIVGPTTQSAKLTSALLAQRPGWANIKALHDGRVYLVDSDTSSRPGPRLVDALESLARALYPELFG
jgi:iron complex transport system substrate-binding protein